MPSESGFVLSGSGTVLSGSGYVQSGSRYVLFWINDFKYRLDQFHVPSGSFSYAVWITLMYSGSTSMLYG